jgi:hypothetical protein
MPAAGIVWPIRARPMSGINEVADFCCWHLVRRTFLGEMDPRDCHLGLRLAQSKLRTVRSLCLPG